VEEELGHTIFNAVVVVAALVMAFPLLFYASQQLRRSKRLTRGLYLLSAVFFSFAFLQERNRELIEVSDDEICRKKDAKFGDPNHEENDSSMAD
jgi:hypothetical protein